MRDRIINFLYKFPIIIFLLVFIYILGLNIIYNVKKVQIFSIFLGILFVLGYLFLFSKIKKMEFKNKKLVKWTLLGAAFLFLLFLGYQTRVGIYDTWDFGGLIRCSYEEAHGIRSEAWYFARYPNNIPLLIFETVLCKVAMFFYKDLSLGAFRGLTILVNTIIIFASILLLNNMIKRKLGKKSATLAHLVTMLFCPLYLYCATLYTDTVSMLLLLLALFCYNWYDNSVSKKSRIVFMIATMAFIYLGFRFKATSIFLLIALCMNFICEQKWKELGISLLTIICVSVPINCCIDLGYKVLPEDKNRFEFPYAHWVMMALNPETAGDYNWDDVIYTTSFDNYESKKEANIKKIKERIQDYGFIKLAYRILGRKNIKIWADPTFETSYYLSWHPISKNIFSEIFTTNGRCHNIYKTYITAFYLFLLFGAVLSAYYNLQEKNNFVFISQLMLVGIFLFELVWESNARYVYNFLPFLVITACYGYTRLLERFSIKHKYIQEV